MEGVVFLLAVGGVPASIAMVVGLWRGVQKKKRVAGDGFGSHLLNRNPDCHDWTGFIVVGCYVSSLRIVFVNMLIKNNGYRRLRSRLSKPCAATASPTTWANAWGLSSISPGQGFAGAVWNIQGLDYLRARREGHFENATIPVLFIVSEGRKTNAGNRDIVVMDVQVSTGKDAQLIIKVSHPDL